MSTSPVTPSGEPPAGDNRRRRNLIMAAVAVIVLLGFGFWLYQRHKESTDDAQVEGHLQPIAPRVAGTVIEVDVLENQIVRRGQVLFRLDPRPFQDSLRQAQALLARAQAQALGAHSNIPVSLATTGGGLSAARAGLATARANQLLARQQLMTARAQLSSALANQVRARADARKAAHDRRRYALLAKKQEISRERYDAVRTAAIAAAAQARAAAAAVLAARYGVAGAKAAVQAAASRTAAARAQVRAASAGPQQVAMAHAAAASARAAVRAAQAAVAQARLNLSYTVLRAPTAGRIGDKTVELGERLSVGQPVMAVIPVHNIWITANYKETDLQNMRPGEKVGIHVDAFSQDFRGYVQSIGSATGEKFSLMPPENATGNYVKVVQRVPVKILFDPGQHIHRLRPGLSVETTVYTNRMDPRVKITAQTGALAPGASLP